MEALEGAAVAAGGGDVDVREVVPAEGEAEGLPDVQVLAGGEGPVGRVADETPPCVGAPDLGAILAADAWARARAAELLA